MYQLLCLCGQKMNIRGSQAGSSVMCICGKQCQVPMLSVLKFHKERNEAAPTNDATSTVPADAPNNVIDSGPVMRFFHLLGKVGPDGNVSNLAMNHYVTLVQTRVWEMLMPPELAPFAELILSVAIAPGDQKRIELAHYPKSATFDQQESLMKEIGEIEVPPIHESPVAFGIYFRMRPVPDKEASFSVFPSLSKAIESNGMEAAIAQSFARQSTSGTKAVSKASEPVATKWWRRLFGRRKPQPPLVAEKSVAQDFHLAQEQWLAHCQALAREYSWVDLKRAILNDPDDLRYVVAFAEKHCEQAAWALAIEWYDAPIRQLDYCVPLVGRRAELHRCAGNMQAALSDYSRAIDQAPHVAWYRVQRALIYAELQAWDQAVLDLNEAIRFAPIEPECFYYRAQVRLQQNEAREAMDDFHQAIRLDPNFGQAHFSLGWLYSCNFNDKASEAIRHLTRAVDLTDNNGDIRLHRSLAYLAQNKYALALEDCDHVLAITPDNALALGIRGRVLQCEGQFEEAIVACTRAIELGHEHPLVYLARAICYASTDQPTLAASDCDLSLAIEPNNALAIQFQGRLKLQIGDLDAAMDAFNRARELAPDWAEPREQLSLVHRMKENPRAAVEEQTLLITQQPRLASHYINRAFAYTQMQAYVEAANDYDRAVAIEPENEHLYFLRGIFRLNCQETELALADFQRVLAINGGDDNARAHRAGLLLQLRRYQEAIDDFAQLIAKYPEHPHAYSGRAVAFAALGNTERADQDAERLSEVAPELADGVQRSTEAANLYRLMRSEEYDAALEAANEMIMNWPEETLGYRLRAYVRWEREEYVDANDDYTRVLDQDGPTPDCLSSRGQVLAELGEWERALADLDQAVKLAREAGQTIVLAYALNGRSLTYGGIDRNEESSRDFEESVSLCPTNPWVYYHRGIKMFHSNCPNEAKLLLELALEFNDPPLSKRKKQRAQTVLARLERIDSVPST